MEARRCGVHGLVLGDDGRCVICRRGDPIVAKKRSGDWPVVIFALGMGVLIVGGVGYGLSRRIANAVQPSDDVIVATPASDAPVEAVEAPESPNRDSGRVAQRRAAEPPDPDAAPSASAVADPALAVAAEKKRVPITMYAKKDCSLCTRARTYFTAQGYTLKELDIEASPTDKVILQSINPEATVPTFDVDGTILVGYDRQIFDAALEKVAIRRLKK